VGEEVHRRATMIVSGAGIRVDCEFGGGPGST
jgi:hypothetical protein